MKVYNSMDYFYRQFLGRLSHKSGLKAIINTCKMAEIVGEYKLRL